MLEPQLPSEAPFKCPRCSSFIAPSLKDLILHYGVTHPDTVDDILNSDPQSLDLDMTVGNDGINSISKSNRGNNNKKGNATAKKAVEKGAQPTPALPPYKAIAEDKKFPKCRACDYRYFTRLDLCRHFVDNHLRDKLCTALPDDSNHKCPNCPATYSNRQSRVRHFIWSHQDLEWIVSQTTGHRLSEFMPSTRDLEIVRMKNEKQQSSGIGGESSLSSPEKKSTDHFKDITDLAALPVNDFVDAKCSVPTCELCGEEFTTSVNKVRELLIIMRIYSHNILFSRICSFFPGLSSHNLFGLRTVTLL